jgi:adenylate cyclase
MQPGPPSNAPAADSGLSSEVIRDQLATVLESPEFAKRPVLRKFLSFVVGKYLAGQSHTIKEYTVATEVFGRRENFDSLKNSIVRMQAGRLRRALERYYFTYGAHDPVKIEMPKGSYVPAFLDLSDSESGKGESGREPADSELITPYGPTVAVMPLANLTGDPAQEYFCDGLTEELTHELARFQGILVVAGYSTIQMKGEKLSARELGRRLGARFLVEGAMRREADKLKFSVRLVDTITGLQIWGEQYRRELKAQSLIALQEDIAGNVAGKIADPFGVICAQLSRESQKKPAKSFNTYDAFLKFHDYNTSFSAESLTGALPALEQAVAENPESGLAWSLLANVSAIIYSLGYPLLNTTSEKIMALALKGVSLEPGNQLVRIIHALALFLYDDREGFFREAELAVELNPHNPASVGFIGWARALYGDWKPGLALLKEAMELNRLFPGWYRIALYFDLYRRRQYLEAFEEARLVNMPHLFWDPLLRAAALGQLGRMSEAHMAISALLQAKPDFPASARRLIGFLVKTDDCFESLLDGLSKAGLTI